MASEVETNIVAVERLKEYSDTPKEAEWNLEETKPKENWPNEGRIEFKAYSSRYRLDFSSMLKYGFENVVNKIVILVLKGRK